MTAWSGGYTNELYIYPENSKYKERNFLFRISSATVNDEKSTFTKLNGVSRKLMPLTGNLKLCFNDNYERQLNKYEVESFSGDWDTTSYGKVTDFNLMTRSGCRGELQHISVLKKDSYLIKLENKNAERYMECIYNLGEEITVRLENETIILRKKETLIIELPGYNSKILMKIQNDTEENVDLIKAEVHFD